MPDIKCSVTECEYNSDVKCGAPMIQVDHNNVPKSNSSDQTKCDTFRAKG